MRIDPEKVPFSRRGSYFAFGRLKGPGSTAPEVWLRTVHGDASPREVFRVEVMKDGSPAPCEVSATQSVLRLDAGAASVEICIAEPKVVRLRGRGAGLRLSKTGTGMFDLVVARGDGRWEVNAFSNRIQLMLTALEGRLAVDAPWENPKCTRVEATFEPAPSGAFEAAIEEFHPVWRPRGHPESFDACVEAVERDFAGFLAKAPEVPADLAEARELAAYVNWASIVEPRGHFSRPAMLMSKNWMTNVWSWDHAFNAMALAYGDPDGAWDQLMIVFDRRDASGCPPDSTNDKALVWGFSKPPMHGWALSRMMGAGAVDDARLAEAYPVLADWTEWWLTYRDYDSDGVPQYNHGNDSGWDNCTAFDPGVPLEGADLSAYLIVQMDVLADVARRLGRAGEAGRWAARADDLVAKLMAHSWRGDRFVSPTSGEHAVEEEGDPLFNCLPAVLGARLPDEARKALVAALRDEGRFLTEHGLATESPRSPKYDPKGYWRGPIWAPSTMIVVDGLARAGEGALAKEIARRFCKTCARSGFAENFDALTGDALCDPAYTWTSSAFLCLAHDFLLA